MALYDPPEMRHLSVLVEGVSGCEIEEMVIKRRFGGYRSYLLIGGFHGRLDIIRLVME